MKKYILFVLLASVFSLNAHADWDPVREARDQAEQKAHKERVARDKAAHDKKMREASQKHMRAYLGKDAVGKSDADVERIYNKRQSDTVNQAAAVEAAMKKSAGQSKKSGDAAGMEQSDAAMKAMYGKSMNDIANMSDKERDAFVANMQKQYGK